MKYPGGKMIFTGGLNDRQGLLQVFDQVLRVFEPHIHPDITVLFIGRIKIGRFYPRTPGDDEAFMPAPAYRHHDMLQGLAKLYDLLSFTGF
jgi:hypothetical protein